MAKLRGAGEATSSHASPPPRALRDAAELKLDLTMMSQQQRH
jgi:hypothetical protein